MENKITQLSIMTGEEGYGDINPFLYEGFGELIATYLNIQQENYNYLTRENYDLELVSCIYQVNNCEEMWHDESLALNFKSIMSCGNASIEGFAIGALDFGTINVNGIVLPAVAEQNASPIYFHISTRSKRILQDTFRGQIEFNNDLN